MHLTVCDPAIDGKLVCVPLRRFHFHLCREPGVFGEDEERLFLQLYQEQLSNGDGAEHGKSGHLE